jgi:hypothetical protein
MLNQRCSNPGRLNFFGGVKKFGILSIALASSHQSSAEKFEVYPRFLENGCTPVLDVPRNLRKGKIS